MATRTTRPGLTGTGVGSDADVVRPHTAFMLFTTEQPVAGVPMIPQYRLAYDDPWRLGSNTSPEGLSPPRTLRRYSVLTAPGNDNQAIAQACPGLTREFGYATSLTEVASWEAHDPCPGDNSYLIPAGMNATFKLDGLEGYLFQHCPEEFVQAGGCNGSIGRPDALFLRGQGPADGSGDQNWALITGTALAGATTYTTCRPGAASEPGTGRCGFLGYVFPYVDRDNETLVDGQEWLLGTNPTHPDSDSDGFSDSDEVPPYRFLPRTNPLNPNSKPDPIFANGVEP